MTQRGGGIGGEISGSHSQAIDRLFPAERGYFPHFLPQFPILLFLWPWPHIRVWNMKFPSDLLLLNLGFGGTSIFYSLQIVVKPSLVESHAHMEKGSSVNSIQKSPPQMTLLSHNNDHWTLSQVTANPWVRIRLEFQVHAISSVGECILS